ncbi:hypothetical protein [Novosphingobium sp.]|uniref:hypothetical protein n=1 Tax=Novosphingobium sp. TaxID=1874826 RepID=UPI0025D3DD6A|nr:hypothetical protein [Novosphingobium sp.]
MRKAIARRDLLVSALAAGAAGLAAPARAGQTLDDLGRLLGKNLPEPLRRALPQELGEAARIVAELVRLEHDAKQLPPSPLGAGNAPLPKDPDQLYEAAMPRLVALIDRAGAISPGLGDDAGALLSRLHRTQYDAPDAWFTERPVAVPTIETGAGRLHLPELPLRPLRIADPPESDAPLSLPQVSLPQPDLPETSAALGRPSRSLRFDDLAEEYRSWFAAAALRPQHESSASWHLTMFRQSRSRYQSVSRRMGVPWYFIAAIHGLEASFNFRAHLHNGDFPLSRRTRQVPAGRPLTWLPPSEWEDSAADALRLMGFAGQSDWSLPRLLYRLEAYNGFGYRRAGRASPYLWSFSNLYERGKFVADGHFDPQARSQQCGAAVMLKLLEDAGELTA